MQYILYVCNLSTKKLWWAFLKHNLIQKIPSWKPFGNSLLAPRLSSHSFWWPVWLFQSFALPLSSLLIPGHIPPQTQISKLKFLFISEFLTYLLILQPLHICLLPLPYSCEDSLAFQILWTWLSSEYSWPFGQVRFTQ
jgi:hypothetical protein